MMLRLLAARTCALSLMVLAVVSCGLLPSESNRRKPVAIMLSRAAAISAFPVPYVSVLDTAVLNISIGGSTRTSPNGVTQTYRMLIGERDSIVVFEVDLDTGTVAFNADVLSNNGTRLFSGNVTARLTAATDSVVIPVAALTPVMVLSLQIPFVDSSLFTTAGNRRIFSASVYNRGRDSLTWTNQTNLQTCGCTFSAATGKVAAGQSGLVRVTVVTSTPANAPSAAPRITLSSAQGRVVTP